MICGSPELPVQKTDPGPLSVAPELGAAERIVCIIMGNVDASLAEIGGEQLAGSGFENESPETGFYPEFVEVTTPQGRA